MKLTWSHFKALNTPTEWRARFTRNRWILAWVGFAALFMVMLMAIPTFWAQPWFGSFITVFSAGLTMLLAILIYVHGQAANAKAMREQLEHMQALTQKQIEALAHNTDRQIQQYSKETLKVVSKLSDNSLLLAELLKRELENAIGDNNTNLLHAEKALVQAQGFHIGRTQQERAVQIAQHQSFIQRLRTWGDHIEQKYHNLTNAFGNGL